MFEVCLTQKDGKHIVYGFFGKCCDWRIVRELDDAPMLSIDVKYFGKSCDEKVGIYLEEAIEYIIKEFEI
ncbi:hypothetical protein [Sigmofec virus UA08Rod_6488]|uniref:Uncharacterized protein n=1 Tax=Sigmofec virus UA08Rod_6488 TaxID=2929232 RepID=A0A976N096_9VIRU|nr:hypothetical protein [Sigmofec virus UA08Rod_6488]